MGIFGLLLHPKKELEKIKGPFNNIEKFHKYSKTKPRLSLISVILEGTVEECPDGKWRMVHAKVKLSCSAGRDYEKEVNFEFDKKPSVKDLDRAVKLRLGQEINQLKELGWKFGNQIVWIQKYKELKRAA